MKIKDGYGKIKKPDHYLEEENFSDAIGYLASYYNGIYDKNMNVNLSFSIPYEKLKNGINVYLTPDIAIEQDYDLIEIKSVIFNPPATIVFWGDGSKTVVKTSPHDNFDKEKGILWAYYLKHCAGSKTKLQKTIRKFVEEER